LKCIKRKEVLANTGIKAVNRGNLAACIFRTNSMYDGLVSSIYVKDSGSAIAVPRYKYPITLHKEIPKSAILGKNIGWMQSK
jgi:hypothetical protein